MKNLLFDERPIVILPSLVRAVGYSKAIILQQIHWLCGQPRSGKLLDDGNIWIYNTYDEWQRDYFPWLSVSMIKRHVQELEAEGYLLSCKPLRETWDHTKYYRISAEKMQIAGRFVEALEQSEMCPTDGTLECSTDGTQKCSIDGTPEYPIFKRTESSTETSTETVKMGGGRPPKTLYPLTTSSSELNRWFDGVAVAAGAGNFKLLPSRKRWEEICMELHRMDGSLEKLQRAIRDELERNKQTPHFFSPEGCLKRYNAIKSVKAEDSKWMH